MAFSQAFLEEIKDRNDIEEIIGRYVQLKRAGSNVVGLCPFHNEKTPSFTVFPSTKSFYCFGCGTGGDVVAFIMKSENMDYPEAVEFLADQAGIPIEEDNTYKSEKPKVKKERIKAVMAEAARFFYASLLSPRGEKAREYLKKRMFQSSILRHFGVGYAPDSWDALTNHLSEKGFEPIEITIAFLAGRNKNGDLFDIFRNRIMFPIFDIQGDVVAFSGRRLNENDRSKYVNTSDTPVFKKSKVLFGMHIAKNTKNGNLILCEGAADAIALHQAGFTNAIATLGTAITSEHARLISRYAKTVFLAYDIDKAGRNATMKGIDLLNQVGVSTKIISLGNDAKDPDEYIKKHGAEAFRDKLSDAYGQIDYKISEILAKYSIETPDGKLQALNELTDFVSELWSKSEREIYAFRVAELLDLTKAAVFEDCERKFKKNSRKQKKAFVSKSIRESSGFGDKTNREKLHFSSEAKLEESILGIMLLQPETAKNVLDILDDDCFVTEFNRKVFKTFYEEFSQGREAVLSKNGILMPEEISSISRYIALRRKMKDNTKETLISLIGTLREHKKNREYDKKIGDNPIEGLTEYIENIRKK